MVLLQHLGLSIVTDVSFQLCLVAAAEAPDVAGESLWSCCGAFVVCRFASFLQVGSTELSSSQPGGGAVMMKHGMLLWAQTLGYASGMLRLRSYGDYLLADWGLLRFATALLLLLLLLRVSQYLESCLWPHFARMLD
jgi:hypothetical protein